MIRSVSSGFAITKNRIQSKKTALLLSAGAIAFIDLILLIALLVGATKIGQVPAMLYPLVFFLLDALLVVAIIKSNFRFKYSTIVPLLHAISTFLIAGVVVLATDSIGIIFTGSAKAIFMSVRAVFSLSIALIALLNSRTNKKASITSLSVFVLVAVCTLAYGIFIASNGFFGQGSFSKRVLVYSYNSGSLEVNDVLYGNSSYVYIPEKFEGVEVKSVSNSVLNGANVKTVELANKSKVVLDNKLSNSDVEVLVDVEHFNNHRDYLANKAKVNSYAEAYVNLYNAVQPKNVKGVFLTFSYTPQGFSYINGDPVHAWFGNKGDVFDVDSFSNDYAYIKNSDANNESDLVSSYNESGYIFVKPNCDDQAINKSTKGVVMLFEKVYRVKLGDSNDALYQYPTQFKPFGNYRYVIKLTANKLFKLLPSRTGFDLSWQCSYLNNLNNSVKIDTSSLGDYLDYNLITVHPKWTMKKPNITAIQSSNKNAVYGDSIELSSSANHDLSDASFEYQWIKDGDNISGATSNNLSINKAIPGDYEYKLKVIASSAQSTLTSEGEVGTTVSVGKKGVDVQFITPVDAVYDGTEKSWNATLSGLVDGDSVTLEKESVHIKDAKKYTLTVNLPNEWADKYELNNRAQAFEVQKRPVSVVWINTEFTYNGQSQKPTAYINGVGADGKIDLIVSGAKVDAGENYTATATNTNNNYEITGATTTFKINKKQMAVVWENTNLTYNGQSQQPTAYINGVGANGKINLAVSGAKVNVGENYTATATNTNNNYEITGATTTFKINKKQIAVVWENTNLTYNGQSQQPTAYINGVGADGKIDLIVSGAKVDAGENYTATATNTNNNYEITGATTTFKINKKQMAVVWENTNLTYNGQAQKPTAIATGVDGQALGVIVSGEQVDAGTYTASAQLDSAYKQNYTLTNAQISFTIVSVDNGQE